MQLSQFFAAAAATPVRTAAIATIPVVPTGDPAPSPIEQFFICVAGGNVPEFSTIIREHPRTRLPSRFSNLLRQDIWLQALSSVGDHTNSVLDALHSLTYVDLRNSYIQSPGNLFQGRLYEVVSYMVERQHMDGEQIANYLAHTYNL